MKKLLATAAVAAAAALAAPAPPAGAAPSQPTAGSTVVCAVNYHLQKQFGPGGGVVAATASATGTCLGLSDLATFPLHGSGWVGAGSLYQCLPPVSLDLGIGTGRYLAAWDPISTTDDLALPGTVAAAIGPVSAYNGPVPANAGLATLVGTADCSPSGGTVDGAMVLTLTVGSSYTGP